MAGLGLSSHPAWLVLLTLSLACGAGASPPRDLPPAAPPDIAASAPSSAPAATPEQPSEALLAWLGAQREARGLPALAPHPVLEAAAVERVRRYATTTPTATDVTATTDQLHRRGYKPWLWRETMVCCDLTAQGVLAGQIQLGEEFIAGDWQHAAAACGDGPNGTLCVMIVALPRLTVEQRQAEPLADRDAVRQTVLDHVNAARLEHRRRPLEADPRLDAIAQAQAADMLARGYYDHIDPDGKGPGDRLAAAGWKYRSAAENIAKGLFTAPEVVERWLASSGHRRNILSANATHHGLGVAIGERDGSVEVVWCEVLAAPR